MQKTIFPIIATLTVLCACQKEQPTSDSMDEHVVFTCSIAQPDTKATVGPEDEGFVKILWGNDDVVTIKDSRSNTAVYRVQSGAGTTSATFVWQSGGTLLATGPYTAVFNGRASSLVQERDEPASIDAFMLGSGDSADDMVFTMMYDSILKVTLNDPNHPVKHIVVSNATKSFALTCPTKVSIVEPTSFYLLVANDTYTSIKVYDGCGHVAEKQLNPGLVVSGATLKKATLTSSLNFTAIDGALRGGFSVSDTRKVYFSKGNVWCNTSITPVKWYFETNQYDYRTWQYKRACLDGVTSSNGTAKGHVGTFLWARTPEKSYTESFLESGLAISDVFFASRYCDVLDVNWQALSSDEWNYLLNERPDAASKCGYATVGPVHGLMLLPDIFVDPMKNAGSGAFSPAVNTGWDQNIYAIGEDWDAMENAGAVFLPAFGYRSDATVYEFEVTNRYWTSTPDTSTPENVSVNKALALYFTSSSIRWNWATNRSVGYALRLVTD